MGSTFSQIKSISDAVFSILITCIGCLLYRGVKFDKRITCMSVSGGVLDYTQLPELLNWKGGAPLRVYWANQVGQVCVSAMCKIIDML